MPHTPDPSERRKAIFEIQLKIALIKELPVSECFSRLQTRLEISLTTNDLLKLDQHIEEMLWTSRLFKHLVMGWLVQRHYLRLCKGDYESLPLSDFVMSKQKQLATQLVEWLGWLVISSPGDAMQFSKPINEIADHLYAVLERMKQDSSVSIRFPLN